MPGKNDLSAKKRCNKCGRYEEHIFAGIMKPRSPKGLPRPIFRNKEGKRWYDGRCNKCFLNYLKDKRPSARRAKDHARYLRRKGKSA